MTRPQSYLQLVELLDYVSMVLSRGIPGAVWVQAEIASLTDRRHLYLDLVQHDESGREVAKTRANLWAGERFRLEGKFKKATGGGLKQDTKVLLHVVPDFHPQYGFSLTVIDLSPEFTLGDMQQKLQGIRETLQREGAYEHQRTLTLPADFTRVAVVSPKRAAGLGDFRREADRLEHAGVCTFAYFEATFQGREASASLLSALAQAQLAHAAEAFDALVIIRGGGASTDLAWLNDLTLARAVSALPMPVVTGIGHARDDTILDEVAARRCDTPSKAIAFISGRIVAAAAEARAAYHAIQVGGQERLQQAQFELERTHLRAERAARSLVNARSAEVHHLMRAVLGLTPERTLRRGYALVRARETSTGQPVVTSAREAARHARLTVQFFDGKVDFSRDDQIQDPL
ncbi:exodeoxyribonuclease VII large subunit [Deinococcus peraridilitoris]|uniref:Exodeoxyribonuclease 7 large subunit n=1 Tax=Deinococcus peraridilitoris (strain DSM 19664 / LMG 22246 / CIP 109416 / KR-200) TaxID=937777 RepID=L0A0G8_DEIPD|nr:exodeoxyribonuclease VII large subunit [Deinococcus peraridilitoris]AFZ66954.1 exonuclease VII, large subunit [Deinococcus peraridilitoris DSM 19664]